MTRKYLDNIRTLACTLSTLQRLQTLTLVIADFQMTNLQLWSVYMKCKSLYCVIWTSSVGCVELHIYFRAIVLFYSIV
jgi:hypothetical protein